MGAGTRHEGETARDRRRFLKVGVVVIAVPVLRRPHRVAPLLESAAAATRADRYRVLFVTDPDDDDERAEIDACGAERIDCAGSYARKINAAYAASDEPVIFCAADDVDFQPGWLDAALARMGNGIGVVGTNDLANPRVMSGRHATHSLVSRAYARERGTIDERDKILHEGYAHNFCDSELLATARRRRAFAFARDSHVKHMHPNFDRTVVRDDVYDLGESTFEQDRRLFQRRARLWR